MKKIVSIILCLTFILGLFTVNTFAYTRPETDILPLQTFENGVESRWQPLVVSSAEPSLNTTVAQSTDTDSAKGKYLVATLKASAWNNVFINFDANQKINFNSDFATVEFDFRIPSTSVDSESTITFALVDGRSNRHTFFKVNTSNGRIETNGYGQGYWGTVVYDDEWNHVKIDFAPSLDKQRVTFTNGRNSTKVMYCSGVVDGDKKSIYYYISKQSPVRLAIGSGDKTTASNPATIHIDNVRAYRVENADAFGYGQNFLNEEMNLSANAEGKWMPTSSQFVFVIPEGSETRNISCISDDGDTNKFLRMNSGDIAGRTYFRRSVSATKMFDMANITAQTEATKSSTAILYQAKFRIDDVTKSNTTALKVTPKIADSSGNASERDLFSINPKDGIVTVGRDSTKKTYDGLKLSSKEWYTLNLFHNVASGYMRAEIIDASGNKQVFEGNETDANVDYGYIALFGFNNSSEEHTVIDFDDLKVYSAAVSDAETFYTLSDFAADKADGTVTATVNVSSDMTNITTGAAKIIIASYKDYELQKLNVADVIPTSGTKTFTLEGVEDGHTVKVMLWDAATNTIKPLSAPIIK